MEEQVLDKEESFPEEERQAKGDAEEVSPQIDGEAGSDSGTLPTTQTIIPESVWTTTTTRITRTEKGGMCETRADKCITVTGDADIGHDQIKKVLARVIRETRELQPGTAIRSMVVFNEKEEKEED
uniref:Band 4.1 C-terminal domain-containing protein n=1 Tax=Prolemur simus TaxID=1328070 RepID=A0A8C8YVY6_PROSS